MRADTAVLIDSDNRRRHALVIDANAVSRTAMVQMMRGLGFRHVRQAQRLREARDMLEVRRFDVVVCDNDIAPSGASSRNLLDELQQGQPLPHATVFVMVAGEATYARVTEAAEAALDSYLVKPFTGLLLAERIGEAQQRKQALLPVFEALEANDPARAAQICVDRFGQRSPYWLFGARLGAELLLRLKRPQEAHKLYDAAQAALPQAWARLGMARAELASGQLAAARRRLDTLLNDQPDFSDALDVLGQLQLEQGHLDEALQTLARVARLTPDCVLRQQQCGTLAFMCGDMAQATEHLQRTWDIGSHSRLLDAQTLLLLTLLAHDRGDTPALARAAAALPPLAAQHPASTRLQRMLSCTQVLAATAGLGGLAGPAAEGGGLALARQLAADHEQPDFDIEAAVHVLALWTRLPALHKTDPLLGDEVEAVVRGIARRFCVSKAAAELLVRVVQRHAPAVSWVREMQGEVMHLAEEAMNLALHGDPTAAVRSLLEHGERTRNAKLIDMAVSVVRRHRERLTDAPRLLGEAGALAHRYGHGLPLPRLRRHGRMAGGMALRG